MFHVKHLLTIEVIFDQLILDENNNVSRETLQYETSS